jgi:hypothetical protein
MSTATYLRGEGLKDDKACQVMDAALAAFAALPKTGKPQPNEYTVLAGV